METESSVRGPVPHSVEIGNVSVFEKAKEAEADLERLYDAHADALYRYALALLCSPDDAEDAVAEVFGRLARADRRMRRLRDPKGYLFAAVRNSAYSIMRARRRRRQQEDYLLRELAADPGPDPPDLSVESALVRRAFLDLPLEQREVLVLKVYEAMTFSEIGETVGASINTVASRYRYAIAKLRQALGECDEG